MTHDLDRLDDTFARHEALAPDSDTVLARSHEIARSMRRRRWVLRATGSAVLGAGVIAAGVTVPGALHHSSTNDAVLRAASSGDGHGVASVPTASRHHAAASPKYSEQDELTAWFDAGYTAADAQRLAQLWHSTGDLSAVKDKAGAKLLDGGTLPVASSGQPASQQDLAMQAFFNAGYSYADAVALGHAWHDTDLDQVKIKAGRKLEAGQKLPVPVSEPVGGAGGGGGGGGVSATTQQDLNAFDAAGYTYDDATRLAGMWQTTTYHAKVEGGEKLLAGEQLPVQPSGTPETADEKALGTYFAAGYDYTDAQQLASMWHETDIDHVKIKAGKKLEAGQTLPVSP